MTKTVNNNKISDRLVEQIYHYKLKMKVKNSRNLLRNIKVVNNIIVVQLAIRRQKLCSIKVNQSEKIKKSKKFSS